jgi:SAM-dependent methyltransferase
VAYPERIVPDETEPGIVALHLRRYEFALPYAQGRDVLDGACGVGYGTAFLSEHARSVVGVDLSGEAIEYARRRYARPNARFERMDLLALDLPDGAFDVVCSFETLEHLPDLDRFLDEVVRVLRPDGTLLVSTPRAEETTRSPANPFHTVELSRRDLEALLAPRFGRVELWGQRRRQTARHRWMQRLDPLGLRRRVRVHGASRLLGTPATADLTTADVEISRELVDRATELVAVCSDPRR